MKFEELNLAPALLKAVLEQGYETPTPIQAQAIPAVLAGHDLLAGAQTGTGKTAAFTLPMLHRLSQSAAPKNKFGGKGIRALVLTPTRELAAQVEESVREYGKYLDINSTVVFGGVGMNPQIDRIKRGVDILVATPGRLLDLQQQGFLDLSTVQVLVLDEADRMLDMGFVRDVRRIVSKLPKKRQTMFFSATLSKEIINLASDMLSNPVSVAVSPPASVSTKIEQQVLYVEQENKRDLLAGMLRQMKVSRALVFTRTKHRADRIMRHLVQAGFTAEAIHSNKTQNARQKALQAFDKGRVSVLVATDIVARGIDVEGISHVFNFELPNDPESYVHRIGRTARAGAEGVAISFCGAEEVQMLTGIERLTKSPLTRVTDHGFHSARIATMHENSANPRVASQPAKKTARMLFNGHARSGRR